MSERRQRQTILGIVIAMSLMVLSACSPAQRVAAKYEDSQLTFVVCDRTVADRIEVFVNLDGSVDGDVAPSWQVNGEGTFYPSTPINYGTAPDSFTTDVQPTALPKTGANIVLILESLTSANEYVAEASASLSAADLSADYWLHEGGARTALPCE